MPELDVTSPDVVEVDVEIPPVVTPPVEDVMLPDVVEELISPEELVVLDELSLMLSMMFSIMMSRMPSPPVELITTSPLELPPPPKKPPKKPPPKPPPNPPPPPRTVTSLPPPVAITGCCGSSGRGSGKGIAGRARAIL